MINLLLIYRQDARSAYAGGRLFYFLEGGGDFEAFRPAGATHCTDGVKSTLPRQISPPTRIYDAHISTLGTTCLRAKYNEV